MDGTGDEDVSCCMRLKAVACLDALIFHAPERG
jgi:hypothetical protein